MSCTPGERAYAGCATARVETKGQGQEIRVKSHAARRNTEFQEDPSKRNPLLTEPGTMRVHMTRALPRPAA